MVWNKRKFHPAKFLEIAERRRLVSKLYRKRYRMHEIAAMLGVKRTLVGTDLKAINAQLAADAVENLAIVKIRELWDLDGMERECIDRLEGCTNKTQGSRWMEERRKIKELRAKLIGLFAPKETIVSGEVRVTKEQRDAVIFAAIGGRPAPAGYLPEGAIPDDAVIEITPEIEDITAKALEEPAYIESETDGAVNKTQEAILSAVLGPGK